MVSSVVHDFHNIMAVDVPNQDVCEAFNAIIGSKDSEGDHSKGQLVLPPLPVVELMSVRDAETVGRHYAYADAYAKQLGSTLKAPFMTLSIMALLVIPSLKLSDKGLFDGNSFQFTLINT